MRRFVVAVGCGVVAAACATIAGLDEPGDPAPSVEAGGGDTNPPIDAPPDGPPIDAGASDADAGRTCTGTVLIADSFADRLDAAVDGWAYDPNGPEGTIEVSGDRLRVRVPPAVTGVNVRRQLSISKANVKRMCVSFTVVVDKPDNTTGYSGNGDTTFGFIAASGDGGTFFHGVMLAQLGLFLYAQRGGANDDNRLVPAVLGTKWNVFMNADYEKDTLTIAIDDKVETLAPIRPSLTPNATFFLGIRNFGPAPEAEAFFDDVVVTTE